MGRTKRTRIRKKNKFVENVEDNSDKDKNLISLYKWLKQNSWYNQTALKIKRFPDTDRGVTSSKTLRQNDTLIQISYDLMITFTTIQTCFAKNKLTLNEKLTMQEFLALFLILERENNQSLWRYYINSLPSELPDLPWLKSADEIKLYPEDLRIASIKNLENFATSLERVRKSIGKHLHCVSFEVLFKWAFILVNTRAVYVNPNFVWAINNSMKCLLLDEPSQALCPFLDMFNHHFHANTEAMMIEEDGGLKYKLKTLTSYRAYEQIMISYGPHDNDKLLMQYGFFIPGNIFDTVKFDLQEVKELIKFNIDNKKYKFIKNHKFDSDLYIGQSGVSFNLKALFYVIDCVDIQNCSANIFGDVYPEDFTEIVNDYKNILVAYKLKCFENDLERFEKVNLVNCENTLMVDFLKYRINFLKELFNKNG